MLEKQLRDEWRTRERAVPIYSVMTFAREGLMLGGTVLLKARGPRVVQSVQGQEARVLALLAAAYGKAVPLAVLGNIERGVKSWRDGDQCVAHIHLAHSGLHALSDLRTAAYRLFVAERALQAGMCARGIFQALNIDSSCVDAVEKAYDPSEPRVPAGSGRTSGEWTGSEEAVAVGEAPAAEPPQRSSLLSRMPLPAAGFLGDLTAAQALELGLYAARIATPIGGAVAAFGLLFIPSPNNVHVEGQVSEIPGLRYSWNRDEARLFLKYDRPSGAQRTVALRIDKNDLVDEDGRVVGRIIGGNRVAIDTVAVLPDLVKQDEPKLCPAHAPDIAGSDQGKPYEENRSRQYEDFVKLLINPPPNGPTPSGFVYYLPNPGGGKPVSYDDCKKTNGMLFEIKGLRNAQLAIDLPSVMAQDYLTQARRQVAASGSRPIVWIFAEEKAALFARELFDKNSLERITVGYIPWTRSERQ